MESDRGSSKGAGLDFSASSVLTAQGLCKGPAGVHPRPHAPRDGKGVSGSAWIERVAVRRSWSLSVKSSSISPIGPHSAGIRGQRGGLSEN